MQGSGASMISLRREGRAAGTAEGPPQLVDWQAGAPRQLCVSRCSRDCGRRQSWEAALEATQIYGSVPKREAMVLALDGVSGRSSRAAFEEITVQKHQGTANSLQWSGFGVHKVKSLELLSCVPMAGLVTGPTDGRQVEAQPGGWCRQAASPAPSVGDTMGVVPSQRDGRDGAACPEAVRRGAAAALLTNN